MSSRSPAVKTGDFIDERYRIIKTLGVGSMGAVFLAEHIAQRRRVAMRILRPELVQDPEVLEGFMTEAREAGTLGHPNIVAWGDAFVRAGVPYLVLEYLEGTLLTDEVYRVGGLPIRRALRVADQIAAALSAAHGAGIVHRELKSDHVFLVERDHASDLVKVLDFGISRLHGTPRYQTLRGIVPGSPEFMAPEQITSPATADHRADIYALGVILYEMLTARRPFSDDDKRALLHRVVNEPSPPLLRRDAPLELEDMIASRLLAKDPARRCASMEEVRAELASFVTAARPSGPVSGGLPVAEPPASRGLRTSAAPPASPASVASVASVASAASPESPESPESPAWAASAASPAWAASLASPASAALSPSPRGPTPRSAETIPLPAPPRRSARWGWFVGALVAAGLGGAVMYVDDQAIAAGGQAATMALDTDAEKLASMLDSEVRAAHLRADGIATMPMLRAAVETDAATLKDMVGSDFIFTPKPGEVLELFQLRDRAAASLLRIPDSAPPITALTGNQTRIASDGRGLTITVGAPVARQQSGIGGSVALLVPLDLTLIQKRVAEHARSAQIVGFGAPVQLVDAGTSGTPVRIAIALSSDLRGADVALAAVIAPPASAVDGKLRTARIACWALSGALLVLYLVSLLPRRKRSYP